jgi:hypothetical protein
MRTISGILVGEIKEIQCMRRREVETTITRPIKERRFQRLLRRLLRRPIPMETIPWRDVEWINVGDKMYIVGTEDGPQVTDAAAWLRR